jgi:hypothetical protein
VLTGQLFRVPVSKKKSIKWRKRECHQGRDGSVAADCRAWRGHERTGCGRETESKPDTRKIDLFEKSDGVGGTWRDNTYPGCGCDVPSHLYSYSFDLNPDWDYKWSLQPQILQYFEDFADKFGVRPHCHFKFRNNGLPL